MLSVHDLITHRASGTQMSNGSTSNSIVGLPKLAAAHSYIAAALTVPRRRLAHGTIVKQDKKPEVISKSIYFIT